jgi:outer membrane protein assembly factor BamB
LPSFLDVSPLATSYQRQIMTARTTPRTLLLLATILPGLWTGLLLGGEDWPNYRGPTDQGHADAARLPIRWSESENVAWKTPIAGKAWSTPVIAGNRIWLTNASEDGTDLSVLCVDKESGKVLINKQLRYVPAPQYCHPFNSYASPTPVLEDGKVYVTFGSPFVGCLDGKSGDVLWQRTDFVCNHFRGAGSSPFLYKDLFILHFDGSDRQYVAAMDKRTGKTVWTTDRSVDFHDLDPATNKPKTEGDYRKGFSTPVLADVQSKPVLISLGSMALYAYEPETGKELWRVDSIGSHSGSTRPVLGHGLVYTPMGYTAGLWALRPETSGVAPDGRVMWKYDRAPARRSSPLLVGDWLFSVDGDGIAVCLDAKTGKELWKQRLGGNYSSSPILAGGKVYFFDETGKATVVEAAATFKQLAVNRLDDGFMASPAVSGNALYLRTKKALYRIEAR